MKAIDFKVKTGRHGDVPLRAYPVCYGLLVHHEVATDGEIGYLWRISHKSGLGVSFVTFRTRKQAMFAAGLIRNIMPWHKPEEWFRDNALVNKPWGKQVEFARRICQAVAEGKRLEDIVSIIME